MLYRRFNGWDTGGNPMWEWACCCETCRTRTAPCLELSMTIEKNIRLSYTLEFMPTLFDFD